MMDLAFSTTGKKRFMARQLPFDAFASRKIQKWTNRAAIWGVDFIDAVGVSPVEEMIFFWNGTMFPWSCGEAGADLATGYKRMDVKHLEQSLERLAWSTSNANLTWEKEDLDERAILAFLRASTLRSLGKISDAQIILQNEILNHEWREFNGHLTDNWTAPCARYELSVIAWTRYTANTEDSEALQECSDWLEKAAKWESYDLDARIGIRIATGRDTLTKYGVQPGIRQP
jgi:hypothetical protein